jgi:hypothetical protein
LNELHASSKYDTIKTEQPLAMGNENNSITGEESKPRISHRAHRGTELTENDACLHTSKVPGTFKYTAGKTVRRNAMPCLHTSRVSDTFDIEERPLFT